MTISRDYSYDYLRVFAAIMIVLCHIMQGFGFGSTVAISGYYIGLTYVDVFLLLSAYLLGRSSRSKITREPLQFLQKRTSRIIPTYYTFLAITFVFVGITGYELLSWQQIAGHGLFLNWLWAPARIIGAPLPHMGHLWFMGCLICGYLSVAAYAVLSRRIPALDSKIAWSVYFMFWAAIATFTLMTIAFSEFVFTILLGFIVLFFRGEEIITKLRQIKRSILITLLVVFNIGGIMFYVYDGANYPALFFWIKLVTAYLWIACAPLIFNRTNIPSAVLFLSTISFEIYLVHHPFCLGAYSISQYMPKWLAAISVFGIAILGGWLLSWVTASIIDLRNKYLPTSLTSNSKKTSI